MRILLITYYWPPAGGSGVQRWLKFIKYLQEFSIETIVYTVENPNYPTIDSSLLHEIPEEVTILKQKIWEPTNLIFWKKTNDNTGISNATNNGLLSFVRGNFFIPDPKVFWVKKSVNFLKKYLKKNPVDFIISTGPPHSMHLIGQQLAQKTGVKWIADFRDPWSDLYYNSAFKQLSFSKKKNEHLEQKVLSQADCVITVSNFIKKELEKQAKRVEVITNGFDNESYYKKDIELDKSFSISYIGLLPKQSNPQILFKVLNKLCKEIKGFSKDLELNFVGDVGDFIKEELEKYKLRNATKFHGYVSHERAIEFQKKSQVLLLLIPNVKKSEGILTGKLFEYLTSKRPILALGPEKGDLASIVNNTNAGKVFSYSNEEALTNWIKKLYYEYKSEMLTSETINIDQYHRKNLTKQLVKLLKSLHS